MGGDSLEEFLVKATGDKALRKLMSSMGEAGRQIAFKVRTASCNKTACVNSFGDEQLAVDMLADKILFETLQYSQVCEQACSEEVPEPLDMGGKGFSVAFDPLDGSSIVDTNFAVGTIFGAWPGADLKGITGRDQAAAGMIVYGPRTVFCLALKDFPGCHEFLLLDDGTWQHVKETTQINEGEMFSPGNLRATQDNPEYSKLVDFWLKEKYTLRYTGGMVPDVFQIIVKEKGVFSNVTSPTTVASSASSSRSPPSPCSSRRPAGRPPATASSSPGLTSPSPSGTSAPRSATAPSARLSASRSTCTAPPRASLEGPAARASFSPGEATRGPAHQESPPPYSIYSCC